MRGTVVILFTLFCIGCSKDITLGNAEGRKIFDEVRKANPAIWRQYENVTIIAPDNELISSVVVTDMRPEKDGDVQIINGGNGEKSITIELKSPTVLRGYEFHIEVYSVLDTVATDAEEHLYNEDMTPVQSNTSAEVPDSATKDIKNDGSIQSNESTELPDSINSKDIKEFPTLVSGDTQIDGIRPARETEETEENTPQTDAPEDVITSLENDEHASESEDISIEHEMTTESAETRIEDTVEDINPDSIRPARETELHTSVIASAPPFTDSTKLDLTTEAASETPMIDVTSIVNDQTTTEDVVTKSSYDQATFTPVAYDNNKNFPDYASLNILDYIKNREALRTQRRTEDENDNGNVETSESSVQTDEINDETTPLSDETSSVKPDDYTIDLVPPKIDSSYNTDFADLESTVIPVEVTTLNNVPRAGRGIDFDTENESTPTPINTDEEFTTTPANNDMTTPTLDENHTTTSIDDQFRNTRDAGTDLKDENDASNETPPGGFQNEEVVASGDVEDTNRNVIIVNLEEFIARDENNRFISALPIVLIINSENMNYPIIKIIAKNARNERDEELSLNQSSGESSEPNDKKQLPTLSEEEESQESLEPSEFDYKSMENHRIKGDDMHSGDYELS